MSKLLRVLIVEDSEEDTALLVRELQCGGYEPIFERVDTPDAMTTALNEQSWDIVIADHSMPRFSGTAALRLLKERELDLPFIFVSGTIGEETAVAAMRAGAHDYLMKDNLKRLIPAIERELREAEERRERKRAEETIQHLAYYDALTGLPNRILFYDRLQQAVATAHREVKPLALLILDLDRFKEVNDTMGHHSGDLLLQQVGPRLREVLRDSDTVARLGGDEFAVLLPGADTAGATLVARKILERLDRPFLVEGLSLEIRASVGIGLFPEHGREAETLMRRTDVAMYIAKNEGRGYAIYASENDQYSPRRLALMGELRQAIEQDQLVLYYQPKIDIWTGRLAGLEALVRWQHPRQGLIPPNGFIGLAEQSGLIKPLTHWVMERALEQCQAWRREGVNISVAVNLSARNLQDTQLPDQLASLLRGGDIAPDCLELELTESIIMSDPASALEILTRLSKTGVGLSVDDFGTGYSSLAYLKKLPVDAIKIDKSFVANMLRDQDDATIVRSTIDLAHNLGLKVVAEGVESRGIWEMLAALGCDAAQGYYLSPPIPAAELSRWLSESPWDWKTGREPSIGSKLRRKPRASRTTTEGQA